MFTGATRGVLPSEVLTGTSATVGFATTSDSGYTWTLASTLHVPLPKRSVTAVPPAGYAFIALPSASTWWVLAAAQRGVTSWVSTDYGRSWSATDGAVPGIPLGLQAIDASHAWLTALVKIRRPGAAGCSTPPGTADAAGSRYSQAERTAGWWPLSDANRCYGPGVVTDARDAQI